MLKSLSGMCSISAVSQAAIPGQRRVVPVSFVVCGFLAGLLPQWGSAAEPGEGVGEEQGRTGPVQDGLKCCGPASGSR